MYDGEAKLNCGSEEEDDEEEATAGERQAEGYGRLWEGKVEVSQNVLTKLIALRNSASNASAEVEEERAASSASETEVEDIEDIN